MKVLSRRDGYVQDPTRYFNFERFAKKCGDFVLIEAGFEKETMWEHYDLRGKELKNILKKKIVRLEFEEPNKFFIGDNPDEYDSQFYKIFTLCPYTADWLNAKNKNKKRIPIYFVYNEEFIPPKAEKKYDIIYTGHIVSKTLLNDLKTMSKFNYRFVSNSKHELVTNMSAPYDEKMRLITQSKITLVHNLLYPNFYHILNVWRLSGYRNNGAFKLIPPIYKPWELLTNKNIVVPQLKSRVFEAAFGRSLILCKRDPFNVIERYFEPDKEFIYYDDTNLESKITEILKNFSKYEKVIDNAYNKAVDNYTVTKFVDTYLKNLK
ncbi:hypothetical protein COV24_02115 [candidate division WWE3 bacterium CG10_big_fil_rev_8_21_14_0_10_32_10]|uniref:Spore protein YkvP/CgeB glycosyl transferase-like domain-containing protein n=1 Tax=candidate division WWE3 bacterium CG10_big_fil_rev_8_21_14_0_10_32_10 TaxID=1975090 RepID=A0A2H0RAU0_UNCKA|nr:MAG: hypothetical protein COV24_02115 [candidate division WWE3 bacterium CG10_big_fil_rev_8_21_14_0_10_32_10]